MAEVTMEVKKSGRKAKLHELLAALGDAEAKSTMTQNEAIETFTKRAPHFMGTHRTLKMFKEEDKNLENASIEHQELTTTVGAKLKYVQKDIIRWWDAFLQKEATNQVAKADLIVDGETLVEQMPAAFYLGMEKELKQLRKMYEAIPTLAPGTKWEPDPMSVAADGSKGVYRNANPETKIKTKQTIAHKVIVQATKEHPAQVEKWTDQEPVGTFTLEVVSGMISPSEKSALLGRVSKLIDAVKRARMRANDQEVVKVAIGKTLMKYIHDGEEIDSKE